MDNKELVSTSEDGKAKAEAKDGNANKDAEESFEWLQTEASTVFPIDYSVSDFAGKIGAYRRNVTAWLFDKSYVKRDLLKSALSDNADIIKYEQAIKRPTNEDDITGPKKLPIPLEAFPLLKCYCDLVANDKDKQFGKKNGMDQLSEDDRADFMRKLYGRLHDEIVPYHCDDPLDTNAFCRHVAFGYEPFCESILQDKWTHELNIRIGQIIDAAKTVTYRDQAALLYQCCIDLDQIYFQLLSAPQKGGEASASQKGSAESIAKSETNTNNYGLNVLLENLLSIRETWKTKSTSSAALSTFNIPNISIKTNGESVTHLKYAFSRLSNVTRKNKYKGLMSATRESYLRYLAEQAAKPIVHQRPAKGDQNNAVLGNEVISFEQTYLKLYDYLSISRQIVPSNDTQTTKDALKNLVEKILKEQCLSAYYSCFSSDNPNNQQPVTTDPTYLDNFLKNITYKYSGNIFYEFQEFTILLKRYNRILQYFEFIQQFVDALYDKKDGSSTESSQEDGSLTELSDELKGSYYTLLLNYIEKIGFYYEASTTFAKLIKHVWDLINNSPQDIFDDKMEFRDKKSFSHQFVEKSHCAAQFLELSSSFPYTDEDAEWCLMAYEKASIPYPLEEHRLGIWLRLLDLYLRGILLLLLQHIVQDQTEKLTDKIYPLLMNQAEKQMPSPKL